MATWNCSINAGHNIFDSNRAHECGGAIDASENTAAILTNTSFNNNTASGDGGGLRIQNGKIAMMDNTFSGNVAGGDGGAVGFYDSEGEIVIEDNSFVRNIALDDGGAMDIDAREYTGTTIINTIFNNNTAGDDAGGVRLRKGTVVVVNTTFSDNIAQRSAGAVEYGECNVSLNFNIFQELVDMVVVH